MAKAFSSETGFMKVAEVGGSPSTLSHFISWEYEDQNDKGEFVDSESGGKKQVTAGPGSCSGTIQHNTPDGLDRFEAGTFLDVELHIDDTGNNYREGTIYIESTGGTKVTKEDGNTVVKRSTKFMFDGAWTNYGTLSSEAATTT